VRCGRRPRGCGCGCRWCRGGCCRGRRHGSRWRTCRWCGGRCSGRRRSGPGRRRCGRCGCRRRSRPRTDQARRASRNLGGLSGRSGGGRRRSRHLAGGRILDRGAACGRTARCGHLLGRSRRACGCAGTGASGEGRRLGGRGRLGRLLGRGRLLRLYRSTQTIGVGLATDAVRLGVLNGGRVALDPDTQGKSQLEPFLVGQAELFGQLVDANLLRQVVLFVLCPTPGPAGSPAPYPRTSGVTRPTPP
jgi:hypothetical protein